jgi:hypothetical protein
MLGLDGYEHSARRCCLSGMQGADRLRSRAPVASAKFMADPTTGCGLEGQLAIEIKADGRHQVLSQVYGSYVTIRIGI